MNNGELTSYQKDREKRLEYAKNYYKKHKRKIIRYHHVNKDKINLKARLNNLHKAEMWNQLSEKRQLELMNKKSKELLRT